MDFFLWEHLKKPVYAVSPTIIEDLVARLQAAVTTADVNMLGHVRDNAMQRTAICLEKDKGRFKHLL
jgi:hypothetical protein